MLLLSLLTGVSPLPAAWRQDHLLVCVDLALGLTAYVLVWYRRRWPMAVASIITLFGAAQRDRVGSGRARRGLAGHPAAVVAARP